MRSLPKFTSLDTEEFTHPDVWQREEYPDWSRLTIGVRDQEIPLILDLSSSLPGPFGVLYVLLTSRCGREPGRYQSPYPIPHEDLKLFLYTFQNYFEQDGRHDLWVTSVGGEGQLVFDNHNVVYAYGPMDEYERRLRLRGLEPGEVRHPSPHTHNYHLEFDSDEDDLMEHWEWIHFPLDPSDDP